MFPVGTAQTLPEIYAMGFRNPFRIHFDKKTGWILMGDYGPDAGSTNPHRGPQGSVEWNVVKQPGFYGWPYCIRENVPYQDITYTSDAGAGTSNGDYNCAAPVNNSPNNTGLTNLPAAIPASMWMGYSETDTRFPDLGTGGAPMGGTRYYFDEASDLGHEVPAVLRRPVVHRRVEQRLDPHRRPQQPGTRHRRVHLGAHARATSARWTWSSALTARCTSSSGARASRRTTRTRASTASTTSAAHGHRSPTRR